VTVADEKKTPETGEEPQAPKRARKPAAKSAASTDAAAKPRAARPAAKPAAKVAAKPAAEKAAEKAADTPAVKAPAKAAAKKPAAKKPAAKKPAEKTPAKKTPAKTAAKPAAKAPAKAAKPAEKPEKAAKLAAAKPAKPAKPAAKPAAPAARKAPDARTAIVVDADGKKVEEVKLEAERFGLRPDVNLLHLAVRAEQAAHRRGTASTRTRGEVSGSTAKLYRQKGTGRARVGSAKSPTRTGGGTAFGPKPRSYEIKINRKAAHKALAMALSDRAEGGALYVARGLDLETPSTATVNDLLVTLDIPAPVLVVTQDEPVVAKSVRNLRYAETVEARRLSVEKVLRARSLVVTEKAFAVLAEA
jgi:large subunit ribosomal protein L4